MLWRRGLLNPGGGALSGHPKIQPVSTLIGDARTQPRNGRDAEWGRQIGRRSSRRAHSDILSVNNWHVISETAQNMEKLGIQREMMNCNPPLTERRQICEDLAVW